MAKKVEAFPRHAVHALYDWHEWLDGGIWCLTKGKDFDSDVEHFRVQVYSAAKARGLKARTSREGDKNIYVQGTPLKKVRKSS